MLGVSIEHVKSCIVADSMKLRRLQSELTTGTEEPFTPETPLTSGVTFRQAGRT